MPIYQIKPKRRKSFLRNLSFTNQIIILNILVFIVFYPLLLLDLFPIKYLAISPGNILNGAYLWTLLTSIFMHAGRFHIFANMFSLFFVGSLIEKIIGKKRYLWFYLVSGILAGLFFVLSALFIPSEMNTFAVGASGSLFALVGLLVVLTPNLTVYIMFIPIPIKMKYAAPLLLVVLWFISFVGNIPIGNIAHLGGLVVGLVYGSYLRRRYPRKIARIGEMFN